MISSEEFQQQIQSGQIQEALALVSRDPTLLQRGFTHTVDVTTHLTPTTAPDLAVTNGYLRTKIDLLTGEIHNEVSQNLVIDRASYLNLQQLHITQIVASYRIVQGHLERVKAILTALLPTTTQSQVEMIAGQEQLGSGGMGELTATLLQTRLTQSLSTLTANNLRSNEVAAPSDRFFQKDAASAERLPVEAIDSIAPIPIVDPGEFDEIDLSVCEDDEIWEEWVEDDDFPPESVMPQPTPALRELKLPDLQEHWVRRPLSPIDVKPIVQRVTPLTIDSAERWEKFVPEYIEIDTHNTDRSQPNRTLDPTGMDRLLANLVNKTADRDRDSSQPPEHDN